MRNEIEWEVRARNTPLLKRRCNRCDNIGFYCSEKFRINAHKKNIDIWLIYKCVKCDSTYNLTIFHRVKIESINKDLFNKFLKNNLDIVWGYAFSQEIARKNNIELDYGSVKYDMHYNNVLIGDILNFDHEIVPIKIKYPYDFRLKLSSIIRLCLNLSASQLNQIIEAKIIFLETKFLQKKYKIKNGDVFQINIKEIKKYL